MLPLLLLSLLQEREMHACRWMLRLQLPLLALLRLATSLATSSPSHATTAVIDYAAARLLYFSLLHRRHKHRLACACQRACDANDASMCEGGCVCVRIIVVWVRPLEQLLNAAQCVYRELCGELMCSEHGWMACTRAETNVRTGSWCIVCRSRCFQRRGSLSFLSIDKPILMVTLWRQRPKWTTAAGQ